MSHRDLAGLLKAAAVNWVHDYAQSMGAALAFYTMFSIAPLLLIVVAVAGLVVGEEAARGEIYSQMDGILGAQGALAVQGLLETARRPTDRVLPGVMAWPCSSSARRRSSPSSRMRSIASGGHRQGHGMPGFGAWCEPACCRSE